VDDGGMPRHDLMLHLLDVFMTHFGCQYPALSRLQLERDLEQRSGSTLLFNCIASTASRWVLALVRFPSVRLLTSQLLQTS
jgi:hypothetical protein